MKIKELKENLKVFEVEMHLNEFDDIESLVYWFESVSINSAFE